MISSFTTSVDDFEDVEWKRASELSEQPQLFTEGATRFDINQGELGDCWLLAAIANLTIDQKLFSQVVPLEDQSFEENYAGIFHFRFYQYGNWVDVVVDDYLPTRDGSLIFMRSDDPNEFWTALMEKAYAKLYGSYQALDLGITLDAMVDFTGGVGESFDLNDALVDIFKIMLKASDRGSLMSCSMNPDPEILEARTDDGLIRGHAYSITKVVKFEATEGVHSLVRIRNPWGNDAEWNGPWSDGSDEWSMISEEEKESLGLTFDGDGEFYMAIEDFLQHFDNLEICNLTSTGIDVEDDESAKKLSWHESKVNGKWKIGSTAGGCINDVDSFEMNPQYKIVLEDSDEDDDEFCTCLISLMQKGSRGKQCTREEEGCLTIGFSVYFLSEPENTILPLDADFLSTNEIIAESKHFINSRQISNRFKLVPGTYIVIPSTFEPEQEGEFLLRVYTEKPTVIQCIQE